MGFHGNTMCRYRGEFDIEAEVEICSQIETAIKTFHRWVGLGKNMVICRRYSEPGVTTFKNQLLACHGDTRFMWFGHQVVQST